VGGKAATGHPVHEGTESTKCVKKSTLSQYSSSGNGSNSTKSSPSGGRRQLSHHASAHGSDVSLTSNGSPVAPNRPMRSASSPAIEITEASPTAEASLTIADPGVGILNRATKKLTNANLGAELTERVRLRAMPPSPLSHAVLCCARLC
jgi:hypothetical protein